uniref:Chi1 n=1 Tax=Arundo donax TaxID=35708 RepID=A0A0A8ZYZ5_ARUDO
MLCFVAGETLRSPRMDSSTASQSTLSSIVALPASGTDESLEKATVRTPAGEWVKWTEAPCGKLWGLNAALNSSTATATASVYAPVAFSYATRFSTTSQRTPRR